MKYLFVGAHVDDVELSCGGFISRLKSQGDFVKVISLSGIYNGKNLRDEWIASMKTLNVDLYSIHDFKTREFSKDRQQILDYLRTNTGFDFIFTHSVSDQHQDHSVVGEESIRAFKNRNLATYMGEWNGTPKKNFFVYLDAQDVKNKVTAIRNYESQKDKPYMSPDFIWADAMNNGIKCGVKYAEAFNMVNYVS